MRRTFYQRHKKTLELFDGLLLGNPALERGLIIAPVVVASYNYKYSVILGLSFFFITYLTVLISSFISKSIPYTIRTILYTLIACLVFIPTALYMNFLFPDTIMSMGVFLPLLVANSLIVVKSESRFHKRRRTYMMADLFFHCVGFFVAIVIVGIIRELLGSGSFFGTPIPNMVTASAVLMPFSGFIIVGFLASLVQRIKYRLENPSEKPRRGRKSA